MAAHLHPDRDTIAAFRRANRAAFEAAFLAVLLLARESGLLRLGAVAIDGTKLDANASRIRSLRYDRAKELRAKLAKDSADLAARAEAADAEDQPDPQAHRPYDFRPPPDPKPPRQVSEPWRLAMQAGMETEDAGL